jgi:hypothetical protein
MSASGRDSHKGHEEKREKAAAPYPISLASASSLPNFKHLLREQKINYPMHVSGHRMVDWVQRYACANSQVRLFDYSLITSFYTVTQPSSRTF